MKIKQSKFEKSYTSGFQWMDAVNQKDTFNNFGPNESPERVEFETRKALYDKQFIRE